MSLQSTFPEDMFSYNFVSILRRSVKQEAKRFLEILLHDNSISEDEQAFLANAYQQVDKWSDMALNGLQKESPKNISSTETKRVEKLGRDCARQLRDITLNIWANVRRRDNNRRRASGEEPAPAAPKAKDTTIGSSDLPINMASGVYTDDDHSNRSSPSRDESPEAEMEDAPPEPPKAPEVNMKDKGRFPDQEVPQHARKRKYHEDFLEGDNEHAFLYGQQQKRRKLKAIAPGAYARSLASDRYDKEDRESIVLIKRNQEAIDRILRMYKYKSKTHAGAEARHMKTSHDFYKQTRKEYENACKYRADDCVNTMEAQMRQGVPINIDGPIFVPEAKRHVFDAAVRYMASRAAQAASTVGAKLAGAATHGFFAPP